MSSCLETPGKNRKIMRLILLKGLKKVMLMREIKFRAFHKPSKKWWTNEETLSVLMLQGRVLDGIADDKGLLDSIVVEQYTGLKDKNGVKIFEGDRVEYIGSNIERGIGVIEAYMNGQNLMIVWEEQTTSNPSVFSPVFYFGCSKELEVIGTVHEKNRVKQNS